MIINEAQVLKRYELIIIGAGPAGYSLAKKYERLKRKDCDILIIESGGYAMSQGQGNELSIYETSGRFKPNHYARHNIRMLGGTSSVWSGTCGVIEKNHFKRMDGLLVMTNYIDTTPKPVKF